MDTRAVEHLDVRHLGDDEWQERLRRSVTEPVQGGLAYPGFPEESVQRAFVGSAHEHAIQEAFNFHQFTRGAAARRPCRSGATRYLDFGCGWGRIGRTFLRDFPRGEMAGVDIDPGMVDLCAELGVPGQHLVARNNEPLPFIEGGFRLITAYSVFTHLPEALFRFWLGELLRLLGKGGLLVFTVEPPRFLDFVGNIDREAPESGWHAALAENQPRLAEHREALRSRGVVFLPTGGGPYRPPESYGDTVIQPEFLKQAIGRRAKLREYMDDPAKFWQAVAVVQKTG